MGKKGFHVEGDKIEDDPLDNGVRVINGRVQCVVTVPDSPRIDHGPNKIENGIEPGEAEVTSAGALKVVQG
jgi:hypothetical protein